MAGGLFGRPFVFNEKCIVYSLICMALFLYKPNITNNYVLAGTLFLIFVVAYIAMAWYDSFFNCDIVPLRRGKYSLTGLFKPPAHAPEKQEEDKDTPEDNHGTTAETRGPDDWSARRARAHPARGATTWP